MVVRSRHGCYATSMDEGVYQVQCGAQSPDGVYVCDVYAGHSGAHAVRRWVREIVTVWDDEHGGCKVCDHAEHVHRELRVDHEFEPRDES